MEEFMSIAGNVLAEMRLVIEGAVVIYETDLSPLYQEAVKAGKSTDAATLNTLETALRRLQEQISELQAAHTKTMIL